MLDVVLCCGVCHESEGQNKAEGSQWLSFGERGQVEELQCAKNNGDSDEENQKGKAVRLKPDKSYQ